MPESISESQLVALLEALGFYREHASEHWFFNADSKLRRGPKAVYVDIGTSTTLPLPIIRLYLLERGMHPAYLEDAIRRTFGSG